MIEEQRFPGSGIIQGKQGIRFSVEFVIKLFHQAMHSTLDF